MHKKKIWVLGEESNCSSRPLLRVKKIRLLWEQERWRMIEMRKRISFWLPSTAVVMGTGSGAKVILIFWCLKKNSYDVHRNADCMESWIGSTGCTGNHHWFSNTPSTLLQHRPTCIHGPFTGLPARRPMLTKKSSWNVNIGWKNFNFRYWSNVIETNA